MAPILTIFIGGNHEASNYLQELPYGGWVAPNIYYMGYAGVVKYKGIRIGGISGIYYKSNYYKNHFEKSPYGSGTLRSVYHYRRQETFRLLLLNQPTDIMMSHDWPNDVYHYGDVEELIRVKERFRDQVRDNTLGTQPCLELLKKIKPTYWFSAHLHCKFAAIYPHEDGSETKFLALDRCLPKLEFLQILDIETPEPDAEHLQYDLEWLTILNNTKHLTNIKSMANYMPGPGDDSTRWDFRPTEDDKNLVLNYCSGNLIVPNNFERTAPPYDPNQEPRTIYQPEPVTNPQTEKFCKMLKIDDPLNSVRIPSVGKFNLSVDFTKVLNFLD